MSSSSDESDFEDINIPVPMDNNVNAAVIVNEQWVNTIEYCSSGLDFPDALRKNLAIEKLCQASDDNFGENKGWILPNNNQQESLIVSFPTPVFINEIHIYESVNPGSIVKLEMFDSQRDKWLVMWQNKSHENDKTLLHNIFKPILRRYHLQSNTIRIIIDPRYTDQIGIQAIKLIGSNLFDDNFHRLTIPEAMMKLHQQTLDHIKTDVEFLIDDKILNAHRNILCCRSVYFRALLLDDFSEKSQPKPIQLTDIDYETFVELLFFIYTGAYHQTIPYDIAIKCMIYSNKIGFLTGKDGAVEKVCQHLRSNHDLILSIYCSVKHMSPAFDLLLDYIYELCSQYMNEICQQKEFIELEKEFMIDLICQSAARRDIREQKKIN